MMDATYALIEQALYDGGVHHFVLVHLAHFWPDYLIREFPH
jgi:hypothetical protein